MAKRAVIDVGTHSIHRVLVEAEPDGFYKVLDRFRDVTRLGDGAFSRRRLSAAAMDRGIEVLKNLTTLARNKGVDRILMAATSAVREAHNGGQLIEEASNRTGVRIKVVTGQEEARLIYLGAKHGLNRPPDPVA